MISFILTNINIIIFLNFKRILSHNIFSEKYVDYIV